MSGTTTYFGVTYPTSTDYVKDGASAIQTVATGFDSAVAIPTYNAQTGATYTFALTDVGKTVTASNASAQTYTIPPTASVAWPTNTTLKVTNLGAGVVTFAAGVGVTVNNTASTLAQYQSADLIRTALNTWSVIPFNSGTALLKDSAISGTTGSPTTTTFTESSVNYKAYAFTGSGTITTTKAGVCEVVIIAGGGSGGAQGTGGRACGGGGAGGYFSGAFTLPLGASTITIGAGGAAVAATNMGNTGSKSEIASTSYGVLGGGGGASFENNGLTGGSGGGASASDSSKTGGSPTISNQGFSGANSQGANTGGGGGGAGAAPTTKNGGTGVTSTINGTSTQRAGGGGGGNSSAPGTATGGGGAGGTTNGVAATVNTGGGGGGSAIGSSGAGGSGIIIIRVLA